MKKDDFHFPEDAAAIQGRVIRHAWMTSAIAEISKLRRPLQILEIGSWAGHSCVTWCEALARYAVPRSRVLCVDAWLPYITERDKKSDKPVYQRMDQYLQNDTILPIFIHNADVSARRFGVDVSMIRGKSNNVLTLLRESSFDLVYIDGSHYHDDVVSDIEDSKDLVREGGLLCGDDLEAQVGEVSSEALTAEVDADIVHIDGIGNVHPGVSLAVAETLGRVSAENGFWFMRRARATFEPLMLDPSQAFISGHFGTRERQYIISDIATGKSRLPVSISQSSELRS
jgi:Methyltransferase domain